MPLFQACMRARGCVWTSQAQVEKYEASQAPQPSDAESQQSQTYSKDGAGATNDALTEWYTAFYRGLTGLPNPTSAAASRAENNTCERAANAGAPQAQ